jgi:hypothetical protein
MLSAASRYPTVLHAGALVLARDIIRVSLQFLTILDASAPAPARDTIRIRVSLIRSFSVSLGATLCRQALFWIVRYSNVRGN